jgi:hypothetical protein
MAFAVAIPAEVYKLIKYRCRWRGAKHKYYQQSTPAGRIYALKAGVIFINWHGVLPF